MMKPKDNTQVILALGSNKDAEINMPRMQAMLAQRLPGIRFTPSIVSPAIGIKASPFTNCLASAVWTGGYVSLHALTTEVEHALGSTHADRKAGCVVADIDILLCESRRYHEPDWQRPYIVSLLAHIQ